MSIALVKTLWQEDLKAARRRYRGTIQRNMAYPSACIQCSTYGVYRLASQGLRQYTRSPESVVFSCFATRTGPVPYIELNPNEQVYMLASVAQTATVMPARLL